MKYLVTGASGFIGDALVSNLRGYGHEVVAVVRSQRNKDDVAIGDIEAFNEWKDLLHDIDVVIHCAARAHFMGRSSHEDLILYRKANVLPTKLLAEESVAQGVQRFIYISSIGVHGKNTNSREGFSEGDAADPIDAYSVSKYESETVLKHIAKNTKMEFVIIRPPLVYGPGAKGAIRYLTKWVLSGLPIPLLAIKNFRSFIALDNLINFIVLCSNPNNSPLAGNQVFLIADDEITSTPDLVKKIAKAYQMRKSTLIAIPVFILKILAGSFGQSNKLDKLKDSLVVCNSKAKILLGWRPIISMDEQIDKMAKNDTNS